MDATSNTFMALIAASLSGEIPEVPGDVDWPGIIRLASNQTVLGLLCDSISRLSPEYQPEPEVMQKLRAMRIGNIRTHAVLNTKLSETLELFRSYGLHPVLLKGQGLAANYPDPTARQCGDLDIYVGGRDYEKACAVAVAKFGANANDSESIKHYHLKSAGVDIEIHRIAESLPGFLADRRYQVWTRRHLQESELRRVNIEGIEVDVPPVAFDAVYILNHTWHHFVNGGIGLRQVCDWVRYLHCFHDSIDHEILENDLRQFGLLKVWKIFAYIAVNDLKLPACECPLYEEGYSRLAAKVLDRILEEGNFGRHSDGGRTPRPKGYSSGKFHSFRISTIRYMKLFPYFPGLAVRYYLHYIFNGVWEYFKGLR